MSDDEADRVIDGVARYRRKLLPWRARELENAWLVGDLLHLRTRFNGEGKAKSGGFPRYRIKGRNTGTTSAPPGLPRNFYNKTWLRMRDDDELDFLEVQESVDLTIPPEVLA